jgi:Rps23 Pro-64 3,4-dihydroxylase Tpa1-like proline 4-hydroxylase
MTITESKEQLKNLGYTSFNIKDLDENFYNQLLQFKCNEEKNIQKYFTQLRGDSVNYTTNDKTSNIRIMDDFGSFENALNKKEELLNQPLELQQLWHFIHHRKVFEMEKFEFKTYYDGIKNLVKYFYDFDEAQEFAVDANFTYYTKGCFLQNHSDGTGTGRICALLIYLNEEYDENDGGILILNNEEKVIPTFGKVAIIDLNSFDIPHMVTKVTGGIGRYSILSFIKRKEDEFK